MRRELLSFSLVLLFTAMIAVCSAQPQVWHQGIRSTNTNLRGAPVVVGEITISVDQAGDVLVHFDGHCAADPGDLIVLAASNTTDWTVNDGNTGVEMPNSDVNRRPFSHTRMYSVPAGTHTFYAVAENYVETDGSGVASIYASLTVKFFPDVANEAYARHQGISQTGVNVRGADVVLAQETIEVSTAGNVLVRFDGLAYADVGDRIVLAANNIPFWTSNDGNISVEAIDEDLNSLSFSHSRMFPVEAGSHTFYAVAENWVEEQGNGTTSVYGSLTTEFYPEVANQAFVYGSGIVDVAVPVRESPVAVGEINFNAPLAGKVIVHFDGMCWMSVGDRMVLAASNTTGWVSNDGNVNFEIANSDQNIMPFSHTRVYDVQAGSNDFYAVVQNFSETDGTGLADILANLSVTYFPRITDAIVSEEKLPGEYALAQNYPNPFNPSTRIPFTLAQTAHVTIDVFTLLGQNVATLLDGPVPAGSHKIDFDAANLPGGVYFYRIRTAEFQQVRKMLLVK